MSSSVVGCSSQEKIKVQDEFIPQPFFYPEFIIRMSRKYVKLVSYRLAYRPFAKRVRVKSEKSSRSVNDINCPTCLSTRAKIESFDVYFREFKRGP